MDNKPVQTINIHDQLRTRLCDLYENDCIFDKFECTFSGDDRYIYYFFFKKKTLLGYLLFYLWEKIFIVML